MADSTLDSKTKPTHEEIAQRARELFEQSGCVPGRDLENWLEAETQLNAARKHSSQSTSSVQAKTSALQKALASQQAAPAHSTPEQPAGSQSKQQSRPQVKSAQKPAYSGV